MKKTLLVFLLLLLVTSACSSATPQAEPTTQAYPNQAYPNQPQTNLPLTEAAVPRISVEDAKAALDRGQAVIVDVRSAESFAVNHIAGAISIPLAEFETNVGNIALEKGQWIITYCT